MYLSIKNIKISILIFNLKYNIFSEINSNCCNCNKKKILNNEVNLDNITIKEIEKDKIIKKKQINKNKKIIKTNKKINNNKKNNSNKVIKIDKNKNKFNKNENKNNDHLKNNDFRSDNFIINEKKIDKNKIEIKNINKINNVQEFKNYINKFFINPNLNIKDSDLEKFLKHYKSNEELLNPELFYIISEIFKQEVDNDKLLQLIEHKLDYNNQIILNYNKTVEYKDNTIFFIDNNNVKKYFKNDKEQNIENKDIAEDIEIILKDINRTVDFTYDNKKLENSSIKDDFINSLAKVLINLSLNNKYNDRFYVQGMNILARFFLFLTKDINNNNDIIFNSKKAYKLNYSFFNYIFNETFLKQLVNKSNFTIFDCYNSSNNVTKFSDIFKNKISKNLKLSKEDINEIEQNIICFTTMFPFDITIGINNYNNLKSLFLLLFIFDRYNIIFDIFSLYLLKTLNKKNNEDENDEITSNFNKIEEIFINDN